MKTAEALLVIDMQNGVCHYEDQSVGNLDDLIKKINDRISDYAAEERPVIFLQHTDNYLEKGSQKWDIIPELTKLDSALFIEKRHPKFFLSDRFE
ncbi:MAG: isochorismatase family protein [Alkalibacterium sp.]|nr:isochorismatase family protein [Alkalibacterium sp.]